MFTRSTRLGFAVCTVLALFSTTNSAHAQSIIQTETFGGTPNYSAFLNFDQFDSSLGTLLSVEIELELSATEGRVYLDNDATTAASGNVEYGSTATLASSDVVLLNSFFQPAVPQVDATLIDGINLDPDDGDVEVGGTANFSQTGPDSALLGPINETSSDSGFVANSFFAGYIGSGTFEIEVNTEQMVDFGGIGGISFLGFPIETEGSVTITYLYRAIPEPATCSLLCVSLALFGLRRSRRS